LDVGAEFNGEKLRGGLLESRRWVESYEIIPEQALKLPGTRHVCGTASDPIGADGRQQELAYAADYLQGQHNWPAPGASSEEVMQSECIR
jgi:hypothetical protein